MQKITINHSHSYDAQVSGENIKLNGTDFQGDVIKLEDGKYHVLYQHRSFVVEVVKLNPLDKNLTLKINGKTIETSIKDRLDLLLDKMGMSQPVSHKINDLKAPMPGLILEICVEPGQKIEKGEKLMVLEAMKMENVIKASGSGTVKALKSQKGQSVEKNQLLIEFE
jgi:biotin carboxyl carrier protein